MYTEFTKKNVFRQLTLADTCSASRRPASREVSISGCSVTRTRLHFGESFALMGSILVYLVYCFKALTNTRQVCSQTRSKPWSAKLLNKQIFSFCVCAFLLTQNSVSRWRPKQRYKCCILYHFGPPQVSCRQKSSVVAFSAGLYNGMAGYTHQPR